MIFVLSFLVKEKTRIIENKNKKEGLKGNLGSP